MERNSWRGLVIRTVGAAALVALLWSFLELTGPLGLFGEPESAGSYRPVENLAFVLLREPRLPDKATLVSSYAEFAPAGHSLAVESEGLSDAASAGTMNLKLSTGESSIVMLMPAPVPGGEAESAAQFSLSRFQSGWLMPKHSAHLVVTFHSVPDASSVDCLTRFTALLAALAAQSHTSGVYWSGAGATHSSEFFTRVAKARSLSANVVLWSGISVARESDGRLSLLSLGMEQIGFPDLLLVAGADSEGVAIETMYDLLIYMIERGEALPEGDTVGRSETERLPVHYQTSPINAEREVWRVELP